MVPQPAFILIEDINPFHQHIDLTYFARVSRGPDASSRALSERGFHWFAPEELPAERVPQNVRVGARRAVDWYERGVQ